MLILFSFWVSSSVYLRCGDREQWEGGILLYMWGRLHRTQDNTRNEVQGEHRGRGPTTQGAPCRGGGSRPPPAWKGGSCSELSKCSQVLAVGLHKTDKAMLRES